MGWRWLAVAEPVLTSLAPRGRVWELARYRAYQGQLAGHSVGEVFGRAVAFLTLAAASPAPAAGISAHAAP